MTTGAEDGSAPSDSVLQTANQTTAATRRREPTDEGTVAPDGESTRKRARNLSSGLSDSLEERGLELLTANKTKKHASASTAVRFNKEPQVHHHIYPRDF